MRSYDLTIDPPAPFLQVTLAGAIIPEEHEETVPALLDTGSDITAVPAKLIDPLHLQAIGRLRLEDVEARTTYVSTYAVRLAGAGLTIPYLEVILTGLDFVVLGRDVVNHFYMLLNGPELAFDLSTIPLISSE